LIGYPYWCLEKGYGKSIGKREEGSGGENKAWEKRAAGWLRVMKWDLYL